MSGSPRRDAIIEAGYGDIAFLAEDFWDPAIIGISDCGRVVYDAQKMIDILVEQGMEREDAHEYADFNIFGAFIGGQTPIYVWAYEPEESSDEDQ